MRDTLSNLWQRLEPLVGEKAKAVALRVLTAAGGGLVAHDLSGPLHSGSLADSQAPQFLLSSGARALTGNMAVSAGVTIDGVDLSDLGASHASLSSAYSTHIATVDAHHAGFIGLRDDAGALVAPAGDDRITVLGGAGIASTASANTITLGLTLASPSGLTIDASQNLAIADTIAGVGLTISGKVLAVGVGAGLVAGADLIDLSDSVAGAGLTISGKVLAVGVGAGLTVSADAVDLADSVAGAGLTISGKVLAVGAGAGLTVSADAVALTTPGTLSVASANSASGSHTHAVTASSAPGATASLLASAADGSLRLTALELRGTSRQLRLSYDATYGADATVNGAGTLTLELAGDLILRPHGTVVRPQTPYETHLGTPTHKWLSIHGAELWVETLVAQATQATIGGRVLVGPTSILDADLSTSATAILSRYPLAAGDILRLEADGKVEFMSVGAAQPNLLRNASFEDWTSGAPNLWSKDAAAVWTQSAQGQAILPHGRSSLLLRNGRAWQDVSGLTVGASYVARAVVRAAPGAPGVTVTLRLANGGGFTSPTSASVVTDEAWQEVTVTRTAPAGGSLRLVLEVTGAVDAELDAVLLEAGTVAGWFRLSTADAGGTYQYAVTRNLDGTGANLWYAGDAIFNTGQAGSGFIDLYSINGVKSAAQFGPTIAGNVRNSLTYNDWTEHWAIGNLRGLYGYAGDTYGFAAGRYSTSPASTWISAEATNGFRVMRGSVVASQWDGNGIALRDGGADRVRIAAAATRFGEDTTAWATTRVAITSAATTVGEAGESVAAGTLLLGRNAAGQANLRYNPTTGRLELRSGTTVGVYVDGGDASLVAGGGAVALRVQGFRVATGEGAANTISFVDNPLVDVGFTTYGSLLTAVNTFSHPNRSVMQVNAFSSGYQEARLILNADGVNSGNPANTTRITLTDVPSGHVIEALVDTAFRVGLGTSGALFAVGTRSANTWQVGTEVFTVGYAGNAWLAGGLNIGPGASGLAAAGEYAQVYSDATTGIVTLMTTARRVNAGTVPVAGIGSQWAMRVHDATRTERTTAAVRTTLVNAGAATWAGSLRLVVAGIGTSGTEAFRADASGSSSAICFHGGTNPQPRRALPAAATDLTSVIALANALRTYAIDLNLAT